MTQDTKPQRSCCQCGGKGECESSTMDFTFVYCLKCYFKFNPGKALFKHDEYGRIFRMSSVEEGLVECRTVAW